MYNKYNFQQWDYPKFKPLSYWTGKLEDGIPSVYIFMNIINCKKYVGFSTKMKTRIYSHLLMDGRCKYFSRALNKHGKDNFWLSIIPVGNEQIAKEFEMGLIAKYKTFEDPSRGYNMTKGGQGSTGYIHDEKNIQKMRGRKLPEETKQKLREMNLGKKLSPETLEKMSKSLKGKTAGKKHYMYGKHHSEETKQKMREANLGRKNSPETRKKISEGRKGILHTEEAKQKMSRARKGKYIGEKNHFYGKKHTLESRQKMSKANSGENHPFYGKPRSEETKQKLREANLGKKHSKETLKKLSEAKKGKYKGKDNPFYGKKHTKETRKKMKLAQKRIQETKRKNQLKQLENWFTLTH